MAEEQISFTVKAPKEWHGDEFKESFTGAAYLLSITDEVVPGEPDKLEGATSIRISMNADHYNKYFQPIIDRCGTRVLAANTVLNYIANNKYLRSHSVKI